MCITRAIFVCCAIWMSLPLIGQQADMDQSTPFSRYTVIANGGSMLQWSTLSGNLELHVGEMGQGRTQVYARVGGVLAHEFFGGTAGGVLGAFHFLRSRNRKDHFELSLGSMLTQYEGRRGWAPLGIGTIGYRYQKPTPGLLIRLFAGWPASGLGIGYGF